MRHRGVAYPFPLTYLLLDSWYYGGSAAFDVAWWNEERGFLNGIPSIFG